VTNIHQIQKTKEAEKHSAHETSPSGAKGPSFLEVEFLRQLKEELEIFLVSRNFSTINEFKIQFAGTDYSGSMCVRAS
jgi:hypothetical protein